MSQKHMFHQIYIYFAHRSNIYWRQHSVCYQRPSRFCLCICVYLQMKRGRLDNIQYKIFSFLFSLVTKNMFRSWIVIISSDLLTTLTSTLTRWMQATRRSKRPAILRNIGAIVQQNIYTNALYTFFGINLRIPYTKIYGTQKSLAFQPAPTRVHHNRVPN